jgi:hypothetical protein
MIGSQAVGARRRPRTTAGAHRAIMWRLVATSLAHCSEQAPTKVLPDTSKTLESSEVTLLVRWTLLIAVAAIVTGAASVRAQQPESSASVSSSSVERVRTGLQAQQAITSDGTGLFAPTKPDEFRLGLLTFVPPDATGQFISIRVPVGALASRAAHSIAAAQHRRAERAAGDEVAKVVAELQKAQPK